MNRFVYSLCSDLKKLSNGIQVYVPSNDVILNVRVLLARTSDTPARSECLNCNIPIFPIAARRFSQQSARVR